MKGHAGHPSLDGLLTEAGRLLASSLDLDDTLRNIARLAVPELGEWAAVDLLQRSDAPAPELEAARELVGTEVAVGFGTEEKEA